MARSIMHIDMDSFYASVEIRKNPGLAGTPVIVGADPRGGKGRGVVVSCCYEARKFGVHSAMPISQAYARCPHAVYLRPRFALYGRISENVMRILRGSAGEFEQVSIDEAFLDVTAKVVEGGSAEALANEIKAALWRKEGLPCSIGVGPSKTVAKIASEQCKPNGLLIVEAHEVKGFLSRLPASRIPGVGPKTTEELATLGIRTIGELARYPADLLVERFGRNGTYMWRIANGLDIGHVHSEEGARSIGAENTFPEDVEDRQTILNSIQAQAEEVAARLEMEKYLFRTAELKIRFADFDTHIRRKSLPTHTASKEDLLKTAEHLLSEMLLPGRKVRLIGVRASNLKKRAPVETLLSWTA